MKIGPLGQQLTSMKMGREFFESPEFLYLVKHDDYNLFDACCLLSDVAPNQFRGNINNIPNKWWEEVCPLWELVQRKLEKGQILATLAENPETSYKVCYEQNRFVQSEFEDSAGNSQLLDISAFYLWRINKSELMKLATDLQLEPAFLFPDKWKQIYQSNKEPEPSEDAQLIRYNPTGFVKKKRDELQTLLTKVKVSNKDKEKADVIVREIGNYRVNQQQKDRCIAIAGLLWEQD